MSPADAETTNTKTSHAETAKKKPLPAWRRKRVRPAFPLGIDVEPQGERTGL